jgi:UDP-N-acetyl-2-amino-2-deoxyglucuronate dehydrogenase
MSYRFGLIGCGHIGTRHAQHIAAAGQLVAVCDILPDRANKLAAQFNAKAYESIEQLLSSEQVDVVSVCTPNGLHATHSILALNNGCHVLCEKPMAIQTADGRKMIEAAETAGRKLYVVKQNRYNPPVEFVRGLIEAHALGQIHSFQLNCFWNRPPAYYKDSWHGSLELDGGILYTQFSHFIDLLYWFLGDVQTAAGYRANYTHGSSIDFEDSGHAIVKMKSGATGSINYTINSYGKNMEGSLTLFGEKGTIKIGGQYLNELEYFMVDAMAPPLLPRGNQANSYGFYEGSMSNHDKVYENLVLALNDPRHTMVEATEALKTIEIIEKIYAASPLLK